MLFDTGIYLHSFRPYDFTSILIMEVVRRVYLEFSMEAAMRGGVHRVNMSFLSGGYDTGTGSSVGESGVE